MNLSAQWETLRPCCHASSLSSSKDQDRRRTTIASVEPQASASPHRLVNHSSALRRRKITLPQSPSNTWTRNEAQKKEESRSRSRMKGVKGLVAREREREKVGQWLCFFSIFFGYLTRTFYFLSREGRWNRSLWRAASSTFIPTVFRFAMESELATIIWLRLWFLMIH